MRIWVDITDASAVVFFAPIVRRLEEAGHSVTLTARRFAGADLVLRRYGLSGVLTTRHRGGGPTTRAVGLVNRTAQLLGSASTGRFDAAVGAHASDFVLAAWALGIPQMTFLDHDRLGRGNVVNIRLVNEVALPDAVPTTALASLGAPPTKLFRYPGFREEYYLHDVRPDPDALAQLGIDRRHVVGVVRPAAAATRLSGNGPSTTQEQALTRLVTELAGCRRVTLVLVARDGEQRERFLSLGLPSLLVPDHLVDGVGLLAAADFVLGLGGTMTREAVALGTPAYTVSAGAQSAVETALLADGRLRRVSAPDEVLLRKKETRMVAVPPRDPSIFAERLIELASRRRCPARLGRLVQDDSEKPPSLA